MAVDLSKYDNSWFNPGRGLLIRTTWYFINAIFLQNPLNPSSKLKISLLKLFGARVGSGVVLKPSINIKYPWNLELGDFAWIGEGAWFDSLGLIKIGENCCISQGVYFCTGSHNWTDPTFGLVVKPITVEAGVWVGARAIILPGVTLRSHSVIAGGSVVAADTLPNMIYRGNPAESFRARKILESE
jgi:putative colanic acid biosynthesis acetyltransferase WcaF